MIAMHGSEEELRSYLERSEAVGRASFEERGRRLLVLASAAPSAVSGSTASRSTNLAALGRVDTLERAIQLYRLARQGSSVVEQGTHKPLVGSSTLPPGRFDVVAAVSAAGRTSVANSNLRIREQPARLDSGAQKTSEQAWHLPCSRNDPSI